MDILSMVAMVAVLIEVFAVVLVKVITTIRLSQLKRTIAGVEFEKQKILGNLRAAVSQRKVFDANRATLERKKTKLEARRLRLERKLGEFGSEEERRELQRERTRGALIRPTRADGTGQDPSPAPVEE